MIFSDSILNYTNSDSITFDGDWAAVDDKFIVENKIGETKKLSDLIPQNLLAGAVYNSDNINTLDSSGLMDGGSTIDQSTIDNINQNIAGWTGENTGMPDAMMNQDINKKMNELIGTLNTVS